MCHKYDVKILYIAPTIMNPQQSSQQTISLKKERSKIYIGQYIFKKTGSINFIIDQPHAKQYFVVPLLKECNETYICHILVHFNSLKDAFTVDTGE